MYVTMKEKIGFYVPSKFEILHIHITKKKLHICTFLFHKWTWRWVNNDIIFISGWVTPLNVT